MQLFSEIPQTRPQTPLLEQIQSPADLRALDPEQLPELAQQLRAFLMYTVGQCGGHFGAGLGVVELTIALHHVFDTPEDLLVWDVGHQCYPHKIITGRAAQLHSIRQQGGLAPFPNRTESAYDHFGVGHSSTSISAALGMSLAQRLRGEQRHTVAVIGDGAMTAGMAFEALNHAGDVRADMLIVLNDNNMSISANVGALSNYFARIFSGYAYTLVRTAVKKALSKTPLLLDISKRTEEHLKGMVVPPSSLFEAFGCNYIGPIDGHHLPTLLSTLENLKQVRGLNLLHVKTVKGKGLAAAEEDPIGYHALAKLPSPQERKAPAAQPAKPKYSSVFGGWLVATAEHDQRLVGITPAMREGSDLVKFSQLFPERYFDVGIAEQHSLTLAAGFATSSCKPVVAIYSTFLQRAYDQLIHDICLQNLDVTLAIDRAGLVGEDGATHNGSYDFSYLRPLPNMLVVAPSSGAECRAMLDFAYNHSGPAAVRYPRGSADDCLDDEVPALELGKAQLIRSSGNPESSAALLVFGTLLNSLRATAEELDCSLVNMRFVKPLDLELVQRLASTHQLLITIEDNSIQGGAGSAVNEALAAHSKRIVNIGLPDTVVEHASRAQMLASVGLDSASLRARLAELLAVT